MRPMFFERPVVAARPANTSEVGVHARPIGKGISSGTVCAPRVTSPCVHVANNPTILVEEHGYTRLCVLSLFRIRIKIQRCLVLAGSTRFLLLLVLLLPSCKIGVRDVSSSPSPRKHQTWPSYGYTPIECVRK